MTDLGAVNNAAAALGHAATQAPHPMHAAASMARSAFFLGTGMALPSGPLPVGRGDEPAAGDDAIERAAVDDQIPHHRKRLRAPRLEIQNFSSSNFRMWS